MRAPVAGVEAGVGAGVGESVESTQVVLVTPGMAECAGHFPQRHCLPVCAGLPLVPSVVPAQ